jgi:tRNA pseudouridine(38-40) synthase
LDIHFTDLFLCEPDFDSRGDAISRKYIYKILFKPNNEYDIDYLFQKNYFYYINQSSDCLHKNLDLSKLLEISKIFQGESYNFSNFTKYKPGEYFNPVKNIDKINIDILEDNIHSNTFKIFITFHSKSFLRHQIRIIVNSMLDYACVKITKDEIIDYLHMKKININKGKAPSEGLYLAQINYDDSKYNFHNLNNQKFEVEYVEYRNKIFNKK